MCVCVWCGNTSAAVVTKYMSLHRQTIEEKKSQFRLYTCTASKYSQVKQSETETRKKAHDSIKCFVFSIARQSADKSEEKFQI